MPVHALFFDYGRGLFPRQPVLCPLAEFLAAIRPPKPRFHDRKKHSTLIVMRPRKRRKLATQGVSDAEKLVILRQFWKDRVPLAQFYLVGSLTPEQLTPAVMRQIEQEFFDGERQPKVHVEMCTIGHKQRLLRIKHAKNLRLHITIDGKDYPLVRAEDSNEYSANFLPYLPTQ